MTGERGLRLDLELVALYWVALCWVALFPAWERVMEQAAVDDFAEPFLHPTQDPLLELAVRKQLRVQRKTRSTSHTTCRDVADVSNSLTVCSSDATTVPLLCCDSCHSHSSCLWG